MCDVFSHTLRLDSEALSPSHPHPLRLDSEALSLSYLSLSPAVGTASDTETGSRETYITGFQKCDVFSLASVIPVW